VIFFNNVGVLGMCGHGTIGVAIALAHAGRIKPGQHNLETPVGNIPFQLHEDHELVTLENVASYRYASDVAVDVSGFGAVTGDIAWGGNWFFLVSDHGQDLIPTRVRELTEFTLAIRRALEREGVTGRDGALIDHVELFAATETPRADSRNFVLCPGGAWDRSPCGTGTSAKLACLSADERLKPGEVWRQESVIGSVFEASYRLDNDGAVIPKITGSAWVMSESTLLLDRRDPFCMGIRI
jgi:4-hydroxyproline epimerase